MLDQYRRDYTEFNVALSREHYRFGSGQKARLELAPIYDRYSDLFAPDTIEKLKQQLDAISPHFETDRAALTHLLNFAAEQFLAGAANGLTEEISAYEAAATVELAGRTMTFQEASAAIGTEPDRARRQALDSRRLAVISAANDLRAERLVKQHEAARSLGYETYTTLFEQVRQIDYEKVIRAAEPLLARTESLCVTRLNETL